MATLPDRQRELSGEEDVEGDDGQRTEKFSSAIRLQSAEQEGQDQPLLEWRIPGNKEP